MQCSRCRKEPVVYQPYSGQYLCRDHFIADFEAKVKRAIRMHRWMQPGDHIGVPVTGSSSGRALVFFLRNLTEKRRDIRVSPIPSCQEYGDCQTPAGESGITKIAIATGLEDTAADILTGILRGNAAICFPRCNPAGPLLIAPFSHIPAGEIAVYARIHGITGEEPGCRKDDDPFHEDVKAMLIGYSRHHPAAPHAVLNLCDTIGTVTGRKHGDKQDTSSGSGACTGGTDQLKKMPR